MDIIKKIDSKKLIGNLIMIIGIIIFVSLFSKIFGPENTLVGVTIITAILMFNVMHLNLKFKDAIFTIIVAFTGMGLTSYLSMINPFLGIPINFISVLIMAYIFSNKIEEKAYLPFLLCYVFLQGSPVTAEKLEIRILSLLIGGILVGVIYYFSHRKIYHDDHRSIREMLSSKDKDPLQINFALRMAIGLTISMFIGGIFGFVKGMWISATVLSLTQPHYEQTKERVGERILGTIVGAILFIILFYFVVPKSMDSIVLLVLSYIYTFIKPYKIQMIFVTLNALAAAMILFDASVSVPMRIAFVLIGVLIAVVVNKLLYSRFEKSNIKIED